MPHPAPSRYVNTPEHRASAEWVRESWCAAHADVVDLLEAQASGGRCMRVLSARMDTLFTGLWQGVQQQLGTTPLAILAVGGYGRRELFLHSDVDILILLPDKPTEAQQASVQWLLYALWDGDIRISQQVGTLDDVLQLAKTDVSWRTSLLDARLVAGSASAQHRLVERLRTDVMAGSLLDFVEAKLAERAARHKRWGDSRYVLEPNVKEGKGGLRDLHTLYWLARATHDIHTIADLAEKHVLSAADARAYRRAAQFYSTVRMHLHALAGRAEERLTFEYQRALAARLGFRGDTPNAMVERFMKRYFQVARTVGRLTRGVCAVLEEEKKRKPRGMLASLIAAPTLAAPFALEGQRVAFDAATDFLATPEALVLLFDEARRAGRDIHPHALQLVARHAAKVTRAVAAQPAVVAAFLRLLLAPDAEIHLRRMNESELLPRLVPEFQRVVGQMQFDRYHTYTVDEHILVAVGKLHGIAQGEYGDMLPLASSVVKDFATSRVLFVAMLCHDIAKGRGGNHPKLGAQIATRFAEQLGFDKAEQHTVAWLVEHHQLLTDVAFKRDLQDPRVIADLAATIQSAQRLRMVLLMTVADVLAVGPQVWNGWKGSMLREIYRRVENHLLQAAPAAMTADESLPQRAARLLPVALPDALEAALAQAEPDHWHALDDATLHAQLALLLDAAPDPVLHWNPQPQAGVCELWVRVADRPGLFATLAGTLAACGANIVRCQIHTLPCGLAMDGFWLQDRNGHPFSEPRAHARVADLLARTLENPETLEKALSDARRAYARSMALYDTPPSLYLDTHASATHTVLEITAPDRVGLLHRITRVLNAQKVNVSRAYIATYGEQAVDVFYLKDAYGLKIDHPQRLRHLTEALQEALNH